MPTITNFAQGIIPNAAYTRYRDVAAHDALNVRVNDQGHLAPRDGIEQISADTDVESVFTYKNFIFAVVGDNVKWGRITDNPVVFNDFSPAVTLPSNRPATLHTVYEAVRDQVFVGFGSGAEPIVINVPLVVSDTPTSEAFYLRNSIPNLTPFVNESKPGKTSGDNFEGMTVYFRAQAVKIHGTQAALHPWQGARMRDTLDPVPDVRLAPERVLARASTVATVDNIATGDLADVSGDSAKLAANTAVRIRYSGTTSNFLPGIGLPGEVADYIDIYRTERVPSGTPVKNLRFYRIARQPYRENFFLEYYMPLNDDGLTENIELIEHFEQPNWQYIASDRHRIFVTDNTNSILYMSYVGGFSSEFRLLRNFTEQLELNLGAGNITGIKFLQDNRLVVYTATNIVMIVTDRVAELSSVLPITPDHDDKDAAIGCAAPQSLAAYRGYHYFLGSNKRIYRLGGQRPVWVSERIEPVLQEISGPIETFGNTFRAIGFILDDWYYLSYHSFVAPSARPLFWHGHQLIWRGNGLWLESDDYRSHIDEQRNFNRTLVYDIHRNRWWQDSFGVLSISKNAAHTYAVVPVFNTDTGETERRVCLIYHGDTDFDTAIHWMWQSNEIRMPKETLIHSAFVGLQPDSDDALLSLSIKTEEGTEQQTFQIDDAFDYESQEAGFNLAGRIARLTLRSQGRASIDRIEINPEPHTY